MTIRNNLKLGIPQNQPTAGNRQTSGSTGGVSQTPSVGATDTETQLQQLINDIKNGSISIEDALSQLQNLGIEVSVKEQLGKTIFKFTYNNRKYTITYNSNNVPGKNVKDNADSNIGETILKDLTIIPGFTGPTIDKGTKFVIDGEITKVHDDITFPDKSNNSIDRAHLIEIIFSILKQLQDKTIPASLTALIQALTEALKDFNLSETEIKDLALAILNRKERSNPNTDSDFSDLSDDSEYPNTDELVNEFADALSEYMQSRDTLQSYIKEINEMINEIKQYIQEGRKNELQFMIPKINQLLTRILSFVSIYKGSDIFNNSLMKSTDALDESLQELYETLDEANKEKYIEDNISSELSNLFSSINKQMIKFSTIDDQIASLYQEKGTETIPMSEVLSYLDSLYGVDNLLKMSGDEYLLQDEYEQSDADVNNRRATLSSNDIGNIIKELDIDLDSIQISYTKLVTYLKNRFPDPNQQVSYNDLKNAVKNLFMEELRKQGMQNTIGDVTKLDDEEQENAISISQNISDFYDKLSNKYPNASNDILYSFSQVLKLMRNLITALLQGDKNEVISIITSIKGIISDLVNQAKSTDNENKMKDGDDSTNTQFGFGVIDPDSYNEDEPAKKNDDNIDELAQNLMDTFDAFLSQYI